GSVGSLRINPRRGLTEVVHRLACHDTYGEVTPIGFDQRTRRTEEGVCPERPIRLNCRAPDLRVVGRLGLLGSRLSALDRERGGLESWMLIQGGLDGLLNRQPRRVTGRRNQLPPRRFHYSQHDNHSYRSDPLVPHPYSSL